MQILANGEVVPFHLTQEKNIGDLVSSLLVLTNQANKVILEIFLDGQLMPLEEREKFDNRSLHDIEKVELRIEDKLPIALFALDEAKRLLPDFKANLSGVAELLMAGQKHKAMTLFSNALLLWRKIINFLKTVGVGYRVDFSRVKFQDQTMEAKNLQLLHTLQEIKQAIEREDIVTLSDLIEYELIAKVEDQSQIIDDLVREVKLLDQKAQEEIASMVQLKPAIT